MSRRLPRPVRLGLVGGAITTYLAFVGLLDRFTEVHLVGSWLTLSLVLLLAPPALTGLLATRVRVVRGEADGPRGVIGAAAGLGGTAGAVAGAVAGVAAVLIDAVGPERIHRVFVQITPELVSFLTFGVTPVVVGALVLVGASLAVGAAASVLRTLRPRLAPSPDARRPKVRVGVSAAGVLLALGASQALGGDVAEAVGLIGVFSLLAIGLHIVLGYAGMLHLGFVCFFAVGAYATGLLTGASIHLFTGSTEPAVMANLGFYAAVPVVMLLAAALSVLIGAPALLRLPGEHLALVTLAAGGTVTVLISSAWLEPLLGGPSGMRDITDAAIGPVSFRDPRSFVYLATAFVLVAWFVSWRLGVSRIGRDWAAMRKDERRAEAEGVRIARARLLALAAGGAIGSLAGALFAVKVGSLTPATFGAMVSIQVLAVVVLGGSGGLLGVIAGVFVLIGLPSLSAGFGEYRWLLYGAVLVATMLARHGDLAQRARGRETLGRSPT